MKNYECVIANKNMIIKKWNEEIKKHNHLVKWIKFKEISLNNLNTRIVYMGLLNNKIITEATAIISSKDNDMQNKEGLIGKGIAYLTAFRTDIEYENKGYFSILYKFMENDLKCKGFKYLTLGVEPCEVRNMQIYFNWGYISFIKTDNEIYPSENKNEKPEKVLVNYYSKKL